MDKAQGLFEEFCDSLLVEDDLPSEVISITKKIDKASAALEEYQRTYVEVENRYMIALESNLESDKYVDALEDLSNRIEDIQNVIITLETARESVLEDITKQIIGEDEIEVEESALEGATEVNDSDEDEDEEDTESREAKKESKDSEDNIDYISKAKECMSQLKKNALKLVEEKESKLKEDDVKGKEKCANMRKTLDKIWNDESDIPDEKTYKKLQKKMGKAIAILTPAMEEIFHDNEVQTQVALMKSLLTLEDSNEEAFNHAMESILDYVDNKIWLQRVNHLAGLTMIDDEYATEAATEQKQEEKKDDSSLVFDDIEKAKHNMDLVVRMADASIDRLYSFGDDYNAVSLRKQCSDLIGRCLRYQNLNDESDMNLLEISKKLMDDITKIDNEISMMSEVKSDDEPEIKMTAEEALMDISDEDFEDEIALESVMSAMKDSYNGLIRRWNRLKSSYRDMDPKTREDMDKKVLELGNTYKEIQPLFGISDNDSRIDEKKSTLTGFSRALINFEKDIKLLDNKYLMNEDKKVREKNIVKPAVASFNELDEYIKEACLITACEALEKYYGDDLLWGALEGASTAKNNENDPLVADVRTKLTKLKQKSDNYAREIAQHVENKELGHLANAIQAKKKTAISMDELISIGDTVKRLRDGEGSNNDISRVNLRLDSLEKTMDSSMQWIRSKLTKADNRKGFGNHVKNTLNGSNRALGKIEQLEAIINNPNSSDAEKANAADQIKKIKSGDNKIGSRIMSGLSNILDKSKNTSLIKLKEKVDMGRLEKQIKTSEKIDKAYTDKNYTKDLRAEINDLISEQSNLESRIKNPSITPELKKQLTSELAKVKEKIDENKTALRNPNLQRKDNTEAVAETERNIKSGWGKVIQKTEAEKEAIAASAKKNERNKKQQAYQHEQERKLMRDMRIKANGNKSVVEGNIKDAKSNIEAHEKLLLKEKDPAKVKELQQNISKEKERIRICEKVLKNFTPVTDEELKEQLDETKNTDAQNKQKRADDKKKQDIADAKSVYIDAQRDYRDAVAQNKPDDVIKAAKDAVDNAEKKYKILNGDLEPDPEEEKDEETGISKSQQTKTFRNIPYSVAKQKIVTDSDWRRNIETWVNKERKKAEAVIKNDPDDQKTKDLLNDLDNWQTLLDSTKNSFERQSRDVGRDNTPEERDERLRKEKEAAAEKRRKTDEENSKNQNKAKTEVIRLEKRVNDARDDLFDAINAYDKASNQYIGQGKKMRKINLKPSVKTDYEEDIIDLHNDYIKLKNEYIQKRTDYNNLYPDDKFPPVRFRGMVVSDQDVKDFLVRESIKIRAATESFIDLDFTDEEIEIWCATEGFDLSCVDDYSDEQFNYLIKAIGCRLIDSYIASEAFDIDPEIKEILDSTSIAYEARTLTNEKVERELKELQTAAEKLKEDAHGKRRQVSGYIHNIRNLIDLLDNAELKKTELGAKYLRSRASKKDLKNSLAHKQAEEIEKIYKDIKAMCDDRIWEKDVSSKKIKRQIAKMSAKLATAFTKFKRTATKEIARLNKNKKVAKLRYAQQTKIDEAHKEANKLNDNYIGPAPAIRRRATESFVLDLESVDVDYELTSELLFNEACESLGDFVYEDPELMQLTVEYLYEEISKEMNE